MNDGVEAVAEAERFRPEVVLMDVGMPKLNGLEATRKIRALGESSASLPIVALTANAMRSDRDECLAAGMDDFIDKPIDPARFLTTIARALERPGKGKPATERIKVLS